jgi:hypothetical protein
MSSFAKVSSHRGSVAWISFIWALAAVFMLTACETGPGAGAKRAQLQFSGIALPQGYDLNEKETLVLGEGERWTGRLVYSIDSSAEDMFDFMRRQMPAMGWTEISIVRAKTNVLTYSSAGTGRFATVEISPDWLWGSTVRMIIAPIGGAQVSPLQQGDSRPPAVPQGRVRTQPLR